MNEDLPPELQQKVDDAVMAMRRDEEARRQIAVALLDPFMRESGYRHRVLHLVEKDHKEISMREIHVVLDAALQALTHTETEEE